MAGEGARRWFPAAQLLRGSPGASLSRGAPLHGARRRGVRGRLGQGGPRCEPPAWLPSAPGPSWGQLSGGSCRQRADSLSIQAWAAGRAAFGARPCSFQLRDLLPAL